MVERFPGRAQVFSFFPTPLYGENTSAISIESNPVFYERTESIEVYCHSLHRRSFLAGRITLHYIFSQEQPADIFTKTLSQSHHNYLVRIDLYVSGLLWANLLYGPICQLGFNDYSQWCYLVTLIGLGHFICSGSLSFFFFSFFPKNGKEGKL